MCYFITLGIDKKVAAILPQHLRGEYDLLRSNNPSVINRLEAHDLAFHIVSAGKQPCSCGLYYPKQGSSDSSEVSKLRLKYHKKGWSAEKIDRAVSEKLAGPKRRFEGLKPDLRERLCRIVAQTDRLLLIVHWYSGDVETEQLPIRSQKTIKCDDLLQQNGAVIEDMRIEIVQ